MKKREFNKIIKSISKKEAGRTVLCVDSASALPSETKNDIIRFLVKRRAPIIRVLLNSDTDLNWLHSMGYMYWKSPGDCECLCHGG